MNIVSLWGRQDWSLKIPSKVPIRPTEIVGWKTNDEWLALHRCADESKLQP
ncbi:hypothetical protein [Bradyrhizobium erythrophlei]|uniref:hypothetical protein n=1 Tax=Bradyrhizobium erythrophlei TaxID=1437360 RepID=UPI0012AB7D6D|nr:hypothetical protein [Bradyrhizobium erythrophlei]